MECIQMFEFRSVQRLVVNRLNDVRVPFDECLASARIQPRSGCTELRSGWPTSSRTAGNGNRTATKFRRGSRFWNRFRLL